jgi:hypothetical protein
MTILKNDSCQRMFPEDYGTNVTYLTLWLIRSSNLLFLIFCLSNLIWQPHFRRRFFEAPGFTWSVEWSTFGDGFHYFFYILKKV